MSKRQQRNHNESVPTEGESLPLSSQAEEDPELELTPPIVTRTRSGRRIRTPAALLDAQISSPAKTPGRRTRKSTIQEEPEHNAGSGALNEPSVERTTSKPIGESSVDVGLSYELEPEIKKSKVDAEDSAEVIRVTEPTVTEPTGCTKSNQENNNSLIPEIRPGTDGVSEKENQACSGQKSVSDIIKRNRISESVVNPKRTIPLGKPKSGRVWKDRNKQRFSALLRDKPLRSSWEKKMEAKREKELVKKYAQQLKDEKAREREEKRKRREENLKRREENERKAEIVQVIRNTVKLKRMKKKQLRRIEKRDTLALLQKPQPRNQSAARKGSKGDN